MKITMQTQTVYYREMIGEDWRHVHEYASQEIVSKYQPWGPNTQKESQAFVEEVIKEAKRKPRIRFVFAIVLKATGKTIGAGEFNIRDATNKTGEIGYIVNPEYWGKGIATEAARFLLDFGFAERGMHRIFATCDPKNAPSHKVLEKIGMQKEGLMREDILMKDGWRDSLLFSILKPEWMEGSR
ncbi:GNAT family N-acetyltransferase [Planococcus sp. YIM B11945]|uniref:GNAT family N-acetyltransferase n=1 Tax=Planococcus sp. YIM B11945 TaxID=3435410 RepID=UPI003D7D2768